MTNSMLRGLAVGIILATCLLSAVFFFTPEQDHKLTQESVEQYLSNNNLVAISKEEYEELQNQDNNSNENKTTEPNNEVREEVEKKDKEEQKTPIQTYSLSIVSGMNSLEIAKLLEENQIISSGKEFDAYLTEKDLNTLIQIGTYELSSDMSIETIADIITK